MSGRFILASQSPRRDVYKRQTGALCALCGQDVITLEPSDWQIDLAQFPTVRDMDLRGTWIHDDSFEDTYLSERFRLQSWTYRLPKNTPRKIFYD